MRTRILTILVLVVSAAMSVLSASERTSYIYKRGDSTTMMKVDGDLPNMKTLFKRFGNEFIWTRQGARQYVVTDAAVLTEVRGAMAKLESVEAPMKALEARMKPHTRQMEAVSKQMEALAGRFEDGDLSAVTEKSFEQKMQALDKEMKAIEARMEGVEREMERVTKDIDKHAAIAERRLEEIVVRAIRGGKAVRVD
ncbi:MAG TPA: hypothetical protein VF911_20865 [Thermoanaerobaculia bacterium]